MDLFKIDYFQKVVELFKEAFKFKKYKSMNKGLAVLSGICMIPYVLISFITYALSLIFSFLFNLFLEPISKIKNFVSNEGKEVKHATQFIIYFISWPLIFILYCYLSLLSIFMLMLYAILSVSTYIWTIGGFKFHLFPNQVEDITKEVNGKYGIILPLIFVCVTAFIIILLPAIHGIVYYNELYYYYQEHMFNLSFANTYYICGMLFVLIYSLIALAPRPKVA